TNNFIVDSLFITITNVCFDNNKIIKYIKEGIEKRNALIAIAKRANIKLPNIESIQWNGSTGSFLEEGFTIGISNECNKDIHAFKELIICGLKGMAAYLSQARNLGYEDETIYQFIQQTFSTLATKELTAEEFASLTLETGRYGVRAMALLDKAHTNHFGNPEITKINVGVGTNPGILISGHNLKDLEDLLIQTEGTGVDVYTHSEMLPGNYYPELKKYKHLIGNYGNSWWLQRAEFETFNGPVLFTSNYIVPPLSTATYNNRMYTTNVADYPGWKHIESDAEGKKDFSEIIAQAKLCAPPIEIGRGYLIGGFAHHQMLQLSNQIVDAVKSGAIRKFIVMAGCEGRINSKLYYTDYTRPLPNDIIIITAGCAKYRYNRLALGSINGIPRVLDVGQCNDVYSLAICTVKLKELLHLNDINDLPIVYNFAWYEQKAVIALLALLSLGVKNIHLGQASPAFLATNIKDILISHFNLRGIDTIDKDVKLLVES
nr:hydroxylamine reductase [Bacteroidaceae bacterium]